MRVNKIVKTTNNKFLNMYDYYGVTKNNKDTKYHVASRAKDIDDLKLNKGVGNDAAIIFAIYNGKVVVIKQYRYSIDDYIYEIPAGLVDEGETLEEAAKRELKEETGLDLEVLPCPEYLNKPFFTSVGLSDEACATVFGIASGEISKDGLEEGEDIEVLLVDREKAKEILKEGNVALPVGYMLMHYIASEEGHELDFLKQ